MARTKWYISDNSLYVKRFDSVNEWIKDLVYKKILTDVFISSELLENEDFVENSSCSGDCDDKLGDGMNDKN